MIRTRLLPCFALLFLCSLFGEAHDEREAITAAQIRSSNVTGYLGVSLGKCVSVRATIVQGERKGSKGKYFLRVTQVDDRHLVSPVEFDFHIHKFATADVAIAKNSFALHKLRTGKDVGKLTQEEIAAIEKGYLGKQVTVIAYETGFFEGVPRGLPANIPIWQEPSFQFVTELCVIHQIR